jgi:CheY-specific phosphatase CheX
MSEAQVRSVPPPIIPIALDEALAKEITTAVCSTMRETFGVEPTPGPYEVGEGMVSLVFHLHEMAVEVLGEITNMIFGQVKASLGQRGYQLKLGIPCVVTGKGHFVSHFYRGKYMIVPFHLEGQLFQVYVALHADQSKIG